MHQSINKSINQSIKKVHGSIEEKENEKKTKTKTYKKQQQKTTQQQQQQQQKQLNNNYVFIGLVLSYNEQESLVTYSYISKSLTPRERNRYNTIRNNTT